MTSKVINMYYFKMAIKCDTIRTGEESMNMRLPVLPSLSMSMSSSSSASSSSNPSPSQLKAISDLKSVNPKAKKSKKAAKLCGSIPAPPQPLSLSSSLKLDSITAHSTSSSSNVTTDESGFMTATPPSHLAAETTTYASSSSYQYGQYQIIDQHQHQQQQQQQQFYPTYNATSTYPNASTYQTFVPGFAQTATTADYNPYFGNYTSEYQQAHQSPCYFNGGSVSGVGNDYIANKTFMSQFKTVGSMSPPPSLQPPPPPPPAPPASVAHHHHHHHHHSAAAATAAASQSIANVLASQFQPV